MTLAVYGLPSGTRPTLDILSLASSISCGTKQGRQLILCVDLVVTMLTRSENNQLGLAVPGVSGKKKYARMAIGREMIPLMTVVTQSINLRRIDSGASLTEKPSPPSETSVSIQRVVDTGLQESTEDWGNRYCRLQNTIALSKFTYA
jgi:hypothetical protein